MPERSWTPTSVAPRSAEQPPNEGWRSLATAGDWIFEVQNLSVLGFLELSLGNLEAAAAHLRDLPARLVAVGWNEPTILPVWPNTIEALIGLGELEQASAYLQQFESRATASGSPLALATAQRCRGTSGRC